LRLPFGFESGKRRHHVAHAHGDGIEQEDRALALQEELDLVGDALDSFQPFIWATISTSQRCISTSSSGSQMP
jgi:hypothetical protein